MLASLQLYFRLVRIQVRSQFQYRLSFVLDVFTTWIVSMMGFATLALVMQRFDNIAGWTIGEVAFLYGTVELAFGIMDMVFSGFDPQNFGRQVRLGRLDQLLLRPASITLQVLGSEFIIRRLGRIFQGAVIVIIAFYLTEIQWTAVKMCYYPMVVASLVCFFGGLFIIGATISFWALDSIEVMNVFTYGGSEMMSYPMSIYPTAMRWFFTYILPGMFLNYYPALYILGKPDPLGMPGFAPFLAPFAGLGVMGAAILFWRYGLRSYQSTGT